MGSPAIRDSTVLVTGGAGFVGSHLVDALLPHNEVRVLDDFSSGRREYVPDDATVIEGDVGDEDVLARAMDDVDLVFHQAAIVSVTESVDDPQRSHETNLEASLELLERARREDAGRRRVERCDLRPSGRIAGN